MDAATADQTADQTVMDRAQLKVELTVDESRRRDLYDDKTGQRAKLASGGNITGGIGHNFSAKPLSAAVIDLLFQEDVDETERTLDARLPWWRTLDETRQRVLANMTFNMGIDKVLVFKRAVAAIAVGQYVDAARFMLESKWARQVGDRADRLAAMMRTGQDA